MATAVNPALTTKKDAFHRIFEPRAGGCSGACNYTWDSLAKQYVLQQGDVCSGTGCQPCAQTMSSDVRELVMLERSVPDPDAISHVCGTTESDSLNVLLGLYVDLLKRYKMLVKITIGLGLLSAALLIAVIYLLAR